LAVVINEASTSEAAHVEGMVRGFLQKIFEETLQVLAQHRAYLDCLVEALTERHFLLQEDLQALYEGLQATTKV
jgi:ATP-dependent Zn protease